jgi:hypothetical protein
MPTRTNIHSRQDSSLPSGQMSLDFSTPAPQSPASRPRSSEPACCLSGVRIENVEQHLAAKRYSISQIGGAPGRIRTADHLVRSQVLYPAELRAPARSLALMGPIANLQRVVTALSAQSATRNDDFSGHPGGVVRGEKYRD